MNGLLTFASLVLCILIIVAVPPLVAPLAGDYGAVTVFDVGKALLLSVTIAVGVGILAYRSGGNGLFLLRLFIFALLIRFLIATIIFVFHGQEFFGGDANTYDFYGFAELKAWG